MAGLEARSSGWASAEPRLHAFSLSRSGADALPAPTGGLGWRPAFGDLWSQLALGDCIERHADPRRLGIRAKGYFEIVHQDLLALWKGPGGSRGSVLHCAALALELSARVWQAFGPAAGQRHLHLFHRLEDTLAATERQIRAAELPLLVNRAAVSLAVRSARAAIDDLLGAEVDRAQALAALEDAAVDLAALAVRIALNLNEIGGARRGHAKRRPVLRAPSEGAGVRGERHRARPALSNGTGRGGGSRRCGLSAAVGIAPD